MATPLVAKIVLKNTTKMSLNERFTAYRTQFNTATSFQRQKVQMHRQASSANLRLAQQMANRPAVIAALKIKKRNLHQRLGRRQQPVSNIKSRLNLGEKQLTNNNLQSRLGNYRGRGAGRRGGFKPGTSPLIKARLGNPRSGFNYTQPNRRGGFRNRRGNFQGKNWQTQGGNRMPFRNNRGRSNRGGRNRGGGFRRGTNPTGVQPTRQDLDNQLDEYMAETKGSLDEQLGHYMAQG